MYSCEMKWKPWVYEVTFGLAPRCLLGMGQIARDSIILAQTRKNYTHPGHMEMAASM